MLQNIPTIQKYRYCMNMSHPQQGLRSYVNTGQGVCWWRRVRCQPDNAIQSRKSSWSNRLMCLTAYETQKTCTVYNTSQTGFFHSGKTQWQQLLTLSILSSCFRVIYQKYVLVCGRLPNAVRNACGPQLWFTLTTHKDRVSN